MTATEELRRMLDKRGVKHFDGTEFTLWLKDDKGYRASADEGLNGFIHLSLWCITPAQAIDATLGRGTCKVVYCEDAYGTDGWHCDGCGEWFAATFRHTGHDNLVMPHFCPNCGAKVVDDAKDDG